LNSPSGTKNNLFMFDLSSRKKFLELKNNDPEYQELIKVSI